MTESLRERPELQPHIMIAGVFHDWLAAEIMSSGSNQNAILNDYEQFHDGLQLPYNDHRNISARKADNHYSRLRLWTEEFARLADDTAIAHQIYGTLTGMAGAFRVQSYSFASSQEDYDKRRTPGNPLGVVVGEVVGRHLLRRFSKFPEPSDLTKEVVSQDYLVEQTGKVNDNRVHTIEQLYEPNAMRGRSKLSNLIRLRKQQRNWLELGVDYTLFAAQNRGGDLTKVPFMEPLPITHAEMVYPLAKQPPYFSETDSK